MSWGGATSFTLSGGNWAGITFTLDTNQTTSSIVVFERNGYTNSGITFALESGSTVLYTSYPGSDDTAFPNKVKTSTYTSIDVSYPVVATDTVTFTTNSGGGTLGSFQMSSAFIWTASSGPTVTSITVANEISPTRQFTVTHTGTLSASDIAYKINGVDITSLGSPSTPITNLQTTSTGSTFDSYTLSSNGYHLINIGTQYLEFYKSSTTLAQTNFTELNNAGLSISFPTTTALWLAKAPGFDTVYMYNDGTQYKGTTQFNGYDRVEYLWIGRKYYSNTDPSLRGFRHYEISYIDETQTWLQGAVYYIDPVARYESTGLLTSSISSATNNFYSSYLFDFVSLTAQAPTTSNGGGKPDRYPLIMTNLFNRNKSLYSIGMTHKDRDLFFHGE